MSYGIVENVCAALRTGKVSEKAMDAFRKGGSLNLIAELAADGILKPADLDRLIATVRPPPTSTVEMGISDDWTPAAKIMGKGFVTPDAYLKALRLNVGFSDDEIVALASIPWSDAELAEEAALGSILYPHRSVVTLPTLRKTFGTNPRRQPCFYKDNDWWQDDIHKDLRDNTLPTGWRLVRTRIEPNSTSKTWDAQSTLIPSTHERTWTLEAVEMVLVAYGTQKLRPLEAKYAWCQDLAGDGLRACAGRFDPTGLDLHADHPSGGWHAFGLLLSQKASQL